MVRGKGPDPRIRQAKRKLKKAGIDPAKLGLSDEELPPVARPLASNDPVPPGGQALLQEKILPLVAGLPTSQAPLPPNVQARVQQQMTRRLCPPPRPGPCPTPPAYLPAAPPTDAEKAAALKGFIEAHPSLKKRLKRKAARATAPTTRPPHRVPEKPLRQVGGGTYALGELQFPLDPAEDKVLQEFFSRARRRPAWVALSSTTLKRVDERAPRVLKTLAGKYPALAPVIDCPGKRGRGGLKVYLVGSRKSRR
jgi:hypothetical protein